MKKQISYIVLCFLLSQNIISQMVASYEKGSIIKKNGDTINCFVPISIYYSKTINYRSGKNSPDIQINTGDIAFLVTPFNKFQNILLDGKEYMMRSLVKGKVNLFSQNKPDEGYNPNGGTYLYSAPIIIYALNKDSSFYLIESKNYKKALTEYLSDCPEIITRLDNKRYKYENMEEIINDYNNCK